MSVGIDLFRTGSDINIKVVNLDDITLNKKDFEALLGVTLLATPMAQFYFETVGEAKVPHGEALGGKHHYSFKVQEAVNALEKEGKDSSLWKKLDPKLEALLIASACEVQTN
ncbi:MAG: hypothetical protein NTZ44_01610 [Candidatus Nomurabacteria bacterium]|nr:hypothetical protein [Candidatus Nomurabacteria bacterium]